MEEELKRLFGRTPIYLTMDSLYAAAPVFDICKRNNWRYIVRFKEGKIKTIASEFNKAATKVDKHRFYREISVNEGAEKYEYLNSVEYQGHFINMLRYTEEGRKYPFFFITDFPISSKNYKELVVMGRRGWKIENEGFITQKNRGYALTHRFSYNYVAAKNHYYLIQIAHLISQLFEQLPILKVLKYSKYKIHDLIVSGFKSKTVLVPIMQLESEKT